MSYSAGKSYRIQTLAVPPKTEITNIFTQFCDQPWAMLLDSANSHHHNARFDIIVASPIATLLAYGNTCTSVIRGKSEEVRKTQEANPLNLLRQLSHDLIGDVESNQSYQSDANIDVKIPFIAGALGYFGYDLGRCFETFKETHKPNYQSPDLAVGIYTWSIVHDKHVNRYYLCSLADFDAPQADEIVSHIRQNHVDSVQPFSLSSPWESNLTEREYKQRIAQIHTYLRAGDCYQVNLAQRFSARFKGAPWQAYLALRDANQAPFSAFIQLENTTIMSISPERFLAVNERKVTTQPIKGTRPRSEDALDDKKQIEALKNSGKDQAENLMIVDLLRNDLSKSCTDNSISVPALFDIESFEAVHHLVSTVTGTLKQDADALTLLEGAFPGGSITGAPKIRAMQIIDELEPDKRHIYCGSIGYINHQGDMDTSICIRTLLCENQHVFCWAGGGIVLDSVDQDEYQESFDKVSKILPVLTAL